MESRLAAEADVSPQQAEHLVRVAVASTGSRGAAEDYQVAREFELLATREEKLQLLRALFTVSAQHGITTVEDTEISRIASVLRLDRAEVVALRHEFRDAINARQPRPDAPYRAASCSTDAPAQSDRIDGYAQVDRERRAPASRGVSVTAPSCCVAMP